jgi:hypothetical protein
MNQTMVSRQAGLQAWSKVYRFWATSRAESKTGRKIALPALLYSRLVTLGSLLSVALSFARQCDCITRFLFCRKWTCFQN